MASKTTIELNKHDYISLLKRLKYFQNIIRSLTEKKPLQILLKEIILASKKLLETEAASLLLFNNQENNLFFFTLSGGTEESLQSQTISLGQGIAGWVAEKKESLIINDCYNDSRFNKNFDHASGFITKNMICVPMIQKDILIGVIQAINKKNTGPFTKEDLQLFEALAAQCAVAIENSRLIEIEIKAEQIKQEMETAWKIQSHFLPPFLPSIKNVDLSIKLKPAKEIGGDYFNVIRIDENNFLFVVADVSGKSISAALIVSTIYSFLQFYVLTQKDFSNPVNMIETFNRFLIASTTPDKFVTAWFGFYNADSKQLLSINAGHNPTYLLKNNSNTFTKLTKGGLILGSIDLPYISESITLEQDDLLVFYTDGITEAMNIKEEEFGENRFEELILSNKNLMAVEISNIIHNEIKQFCKNAEQSDDITLGIIKIQ